MLIYQIIEDLIDSAKINRNYFGSISITGIIGIPMGDPKFFIQAISLELIFIALTILSIKKFIMF